MSKELPHRKTWHKSLSGMLDESQSTRLLEEAQGRFAELSALATQPAHRALREHLEGSILPGLALYTTLLHHGWQASTALGTVESLFAVDLMKRRKPLEWLGRTPAYFHILRLLTPRLMARSFPAEGWKVEWLELSSSRVAFNMHSCYYLDTLSNHGAVELVAVFCRLDDIMYEDLSPYAKWERTKTLGYGDEYCKFCFRRQDPRR
jgi:hypothetical protein